MWFLCQLQRHSGRHAYPSAFPVTARGPDVLQLPAVLRVLTTGCVAVPPLERAIVDRRVPDYYHGTNELIHPRPNNEDCQPMNHSSDSTNAHHTAASNREISTAEHRAHVQSALARPTPSPEVIAATELLLAQPDAYLYRRRYLELVVPGRGSGAAADYTAAERYLLASAAVLRRSLRRNDPSAGVN